MDRKVLIVEDERDIGELLTLHFRDIANTVVVANDGHAGMRLAADGQWNLVVLDLRLPGPDGLEICRMLRQQKHYVPILMLTSKSTELDRVLGLEMGADDYVTKPFSVIELLARARAILRRAEAHRSAPNSDAQVLAVGDLKIDVRSRSAAVGSRPVELTVREFDLLHLFMRHPGRVFKRSELLDRVWGYRHSGYDHTVNSHINRLRGKIEATPSRPARIVTVWGIGYKLNAPGELPATGQVRNDTRLITAGVPT